ncbi:MAG: MBL fold metallo-hydrolase [Candidatus Paceibacterota bacterium]|jgi:L-ascorbate metabolism protein UlaG (beta-lactamase superfamily)
MKITKYGHCCLLIEEKGVHVLTDPGSYTTMQNDVKNIDIILITHEHGDHLHIESVKKILENNPEATIVTNSAVDKLLREAEIPDAVILEDGQSDEIGGLKISGYGNVHAEIFHELPRVQNTGYMIGERLYYPGDAFHNPRVPVDVLAWPAAGPWVKISDALDFALDVKPKVCFPVHDGALNPNGFGLLKRLPPQILEKHGIKFAFLETGEETEL